jgi:hypothetical protein
MNNIPELNKLFNIEETKDENLPVIMPSQSLELDKEDDYQLARATLRKLIVKGEDTLDEMINLAKNSEHPRTYEVAGQLIKTMSDVAKDLLELQKRVKDLSGENDKPSIGTQNNVVFAGSTSELMKLLKKNNE